MADKVPVTPALSAVYDELLTRASGPALGARAEALRQAFFARTQGPASPDVPPTEERIRASWDEALTAGGLAAAIADELDDPAERALSRVVSRAQRGLFELVSHRGRRIAVDVLSGAEFLMLPRDDVARALDTSEEERDEQPLFDARIVAASDGCAALPGVVFHPVEATPLIVQIIEAARKSALDPDRVCDALLRMEHNFKTLSRVRIAYAYRVEALGTTPLPEPSPDGP